jgi:hypothetical protein
VAHLSVVIPATDGPPTLPRALAAIEASTEAPDEVVVVTERSAGSACGARNLGAARATGDVLLFVDADVEIHPDAIGRLRAALDADPGLTAVYGSYDDHPAAPSVVSSFRNLLHHHVHQAGAGPADTFWTGLGAVRRDHFLAVGGFDEERYPHPSIEDIDLGRRLIAAGGRIRLDPEAQGTHLKRWTLRSMLWTDFARRGVPWVALQLRERRAAASLNCGWRHRLSALSCVVGVLAVFLHPLVAVAAFGNLVALNRSFYALLLSRMGLLRGLAAVALHGMHHLVAVAAVVGGVGVTALEVAGASWRRTPATSQEGVPS